MRLSVLPTSGRPFFAAFVSGPSAVRKVSNCGANGFAASSSFVSLRSTGWNSSRNGDAVSPKRSSSFSAAREFFSNVGSALNASANPWLPSAAAWNVRSPLTIRPFELMVAAG